MNGLTTTPMFFLSPVADSSLAYANIMAEWLSASKQSKVGCIELQVQQLTVGSGQL